MSEQIRLRDVFWGGRVRRSFQDRVWNIARKASVRSSRSVSGNMVSSSETYYLHFLDGGVRQSRGYFDSTCGMFCIGRHATAYVLYQLGADARVLLRDPGLPSASELKRAVEAERARHSATKGVTSPEVQHHQAIGKLTLAAELPFEVETLAGILRTACENLEQVALFTDDLLPRG